MNHAACHLSEADLQEVMGRVFGTDYVVDQVESIHGGAQKVVYKLECKNGFCCVLYVWDLRMNYFRQERQKGGLLEQSYGGDMFAGNIRYLNRLGVRTPALYYYNNERNRFAFDFALVEYVAGQEASAYFHSDAETQDRVFGPLRDMLDRMHGHVRDTFGNTITSLEKNGQGVHTQILENAKEQLAYVSKHIPAVTANQSKLFDVAEELHARIEPRSRYGYIHGELGPNHVLVNDRLEPYLIDIEGAMFFDIEHEHSFMQFRFDNYDRYFKNDTLDPNRMRFYKLHHHISYTSGGLKLLHRGYPDQQLVKGIVEYNCRCALQFLAQ